MEYNSNEFDAMTVNYIQQKDARAFLIGRLAESHLGGLVHEPAAMQDFFAQRPGLHKSLLPIATKAAISAISTADGLAPASPTERAFLAQVQRASILSQLRGVHVRGHVAAAMQISNPTAAWAGEAATKPVSSMMFNSANLRPLKLVSQVVASEEVATLSTPDALSVLERSLLSVTAAAEAIAALDPTSAAITNVRPASLTSGLTPITPVGDLAANVGQVLAAISDGNPTKPVLIVSLQTAMRAASFLSQLKDAGITVVVNSAAGNRIIALDGDGLLIAEGGVDIRRGQPDLIMDSAPGAVVQTAGAAPIPTSLWQANLFAVRVERWVAWVARPGAVGYLNLA